MIQVKNLTKFFVRNKKDFDAVDNVSLEIKEGDTVRMYGLKFDYYKS